MLKAMPNPPVSQPLRITTESVQATRKLGRRIGRRLSAPLLIALTGDLGSGKTALVQGLAKGLDVPAEYTITSPTFTLINEYPGRLPLYHVDLYRLQDAVEWDDIGLPEVIYGDGVVAVEWAEKIVEEDLPSERIVVDMGIVNDMHRTISLVAYGQGSVNLLNDLAKRYGADLKA
jgi:tRNA threonylcarbamoyladenosine biosynthesis protein TsaE